MTYTTIEESKHLLELGVNPNTCDLYYFLEPTPAGNIYHLSIKRLDIGIKNLPEFDCGDIPCWSAEHLILILPDSIKIDGIDCNLHISKDCIEYSGYDNYDTSVTIQPWYIDGDNIKDMVYKTIIWLLENFGM